jgi:hypothetical protein
MREDATHLFARLSTVRGVSDVGMGIFFCWIAQGQVAQLITLVEYVVADSDVDNGRKKDARPDG